MALSEWTIYKSNLRIQTTIDYRAPIAGGGSLLLSDGGMTGNLQAVLLRKEVGEKGFLSGSLRSLIRINEVTGAGCGFVFMMDRENITGTEGDCYGLFVGKTRDQGTPEIVLSCFRSGLQSPPHDVLYAMNYNPVGVFALEVEWVSDVGSIGGTRITVRHSRPTVDNVDFTELTEVYTGIEKTGSMLTSSRGEGIAYHNVFGGTNSFTLDKSRMTIGVD